VTESQGRWGAPYLTQTGVQLIAGLQMLDSDARKVAETLVAVLPEVGLSSKEVDVHDGLSSACLEEEADLLGA
jgi:hypothetical protein